MGRPEPSVLFAQTFVHAQLDEHVDEVLFSEPVVITACEFLEQNAASASQVVPLAGATSPPSFALEIFVQCEGETRFRRLCQPFLYSHLSSNVLEVEAVVTNHLVVRGSYRSLSLVIYGNTAEDLGQFNIEFDDSSLTNLVTSDEGKLEDFPLALHSTSRTVEESLASLSVLSLPTVASDVPIEVKKFLQLVPKVLELPHLEDFVDKVLSAIVRAVCTYVSCDLNWEAIKQNYPDSCESKNLRKVHDAVTEATTELIEVLQRDSGGGAAELLADCTYLEREADFVSSKQLVDMLSHFFCFDQRSTNLQNKNVVLGQSIAFLLTSSRESCFHFVDSGAMEHLVRVLSHEAHDSSAIILLSLGVLEQATRHPIGCKGLLGWWPRQEESIPSSRSKVYSQLLKLFLERPRHDIASLATYVLHRLRVYEVAARYEYAVMSVLEDVSTVGRVTIVASSMLNDAKSELKNLLKLISSSGPVEDSSIVASAKRLLILGQTEGLLSYKATSTLIGSSSCCFSNWDIDSNLFNLLKDRGFLPLSAALLSSPLLRSEAGDCIDTFVDIASTIAEILLMLPMCRSGLLFLSSQPELASTVIDALRGTGDMSKEECVPLRYAFVLLSKGFVCSPREVGIIIEIHLRMLYAIDRLLMSKPHSEEFLWVLWELCGLSRSYCGRQALLVLGYFPEAVSLLIEALHSAKEAEPGDNNIGASPVNLAIFHAAAEIFESIVTDATASSMGSWIGHAMELHKALHSSSPGSNRKDAPTRLLEWIDASVVYHKNGAIGLLRYCAVLSSGGDAHLNASSVLVTDMADVDNVIGEGSGGADINVLENLGRLIAEKTFEGVTLRDSSVAQLTTAIRILAFISENSTVAVSLYDEGAMTVICSILVNCGFMFERSSSTYDYLVDEGTECNSTSDLLLERYREQSLVDLLIPSLLLLVNLLQNLQEVKEQHRSTKLLKALLRIHREVSPKLAACASDLSSPYPDSALGFGAVCHLAASALSFWPVLGWAPGLFHSILASVQGTSLLALGPKEACSILCLLNDLFPNEGIWLWKDGMPLLSAVRTLAVGTLLGPQKEKQINWYLEASHQEKLHSQLMPHLNKIAQFFQHYAVSALVVIQDMLIVCIVRIACQKAESASLLLRPILSCVHQHISDVSSLSEIDVYKVYRYLEFVANLLEHPRAKILLLEENVVQMLMAVLVSCLNALESDGTQVSESIPSPKGGYNVICWCIPTFKCLSRLLQSQASLQQPKGHDTSVNLSTKDCSLILQYVLKFCQSLPIGEELLSCLATFKELGSCDEGRDALLSTVKELEPVKVSENNGNHSDEDLEWRKHSLLLCWKKMLKAAHSKDALLTCAVHLLSTGSLCFCLDGKGVNSNLVDAIKFLFGLSGIMVGDASSAKNLGYIEEMVIMLGSRGFGDHNLAIRDASESAKSLFMFLQKPSGSVSIDNVTCGKDVLLSPEHDSILSKTRDANAEKTNDVLYMGSLGEKFLWECPEPDRLAQTHPMKRKLSSLDGTNKRVKGENPVTEVSGQNTYSRGAGPSAASSVPTRRDTFRQRKPNTSRPPSMHVDDYVARERSVDGGSNSNVIAVTRVGPTGGRPPSIHVDEFMARQRERQNSAGTLVGQSSQEVKNTIVSSNADKGKVNKPKNLKADLDDDLPEIDIVFDGEESETDDKLPFPHLDDNLQQQGPVIVEQSSTHSIVEETESDVNESNQFPNFASSNGDENTQSEFSSRMSVSRPEIPLKREASVSSDKKFFDQFDESKNVIRIKSSPAQDSAGAPGFSGSIYGNMPSSQLESRLTSQKQYVNNSPQNNLGSRGTYNQPSLPPMPPPSTMSALPSQTSDRVPSQPLPFPNSLKELQPPFHASFQVPSDYPSAFGSSPASITPSLPVLDPKYMRNSMSSPGSLPPLPPAPSLQSSVYNSGISEPPQTSTVGSQLGSLSSSGAGLPYVPPPLMRPLIYNQPTNFPSSMYGSTSTPQQGDISIPQSSMQPMHQLQPLQPPLQRPAQPPQHLWPPLRSSQLPEHSIPLQTPMQSHQLQMTQQPQISPLHPPYQAQQEGSQSRHQQRVEYSQSQVQSQQEDGASQQQQDLSLQEYFRDPKAITALLSNKEELCRLLEQHPKLMQMLQERLGQQ